MIGTGLEQVGDIKLCWQAAVLAVADLHPIQPAVEGRADALKLQRDPAKQQPSITSGASLSPRHALPHIARY